MVDDYKEELKRVYNSISEDFDKTRCSSWIPVIEFLREYINKYDSKNKTVLDLGCGTGRDSLLALEKGFKVVSLDFSEKQLELLGKKVKERGFENKHTLILGDMSDIDFKEESFDIVMAIASLHHLKKEEQIEIVKKIEKWVKKGGYVLVSVWAYENERFKGREQETYVKWGKYKRYYYLFRNGELKELFEDTDLKVEKYFREGMNYWIVLKRD